MNPESRINKNSKPFKDSLAELTFLRTYSKKLTCGSMES